MSPSTAYTDETILSPVLGLYVLEKASSVSALVPRCRSTVRDVLDYSGGGWMLSATPSRAVIYDAVRNCSRSVSAGLSTLRPLADGETSTIRCDRLSITRRGRR